MSDDLSRMWMKAVVTELEVWQKGLEEVRKAAETPQHGRFPGSPRYPQVSRLILFMH
jgi:hypothetical protein